MEGRFWLLARAAAAIPVRGCGGWNRCELWCRPEVRGCLGGRADSSRGDQPGDWGWDLGRDAAGFPGDTRRL